MKMAIVGANGQVGTELCFLLRNKKQEVIPIVRNRLGTSFLQYHGFKCRIADITKEKDAREALQDCDVVVLVAYMWPNLVVPARVNAEVNEKMVENSVKLSKRDAIVIYFSSIRAFSRKIDKKTPLLNPVYDWEKRRLEKMTMSLCRRCKKKGFVFRLGHVFGVNQKITIGVKQAMKQRSKIVLQVSALKPSNIVHTVTLVSAILSCADQRVNPGVYTVVNVPQWTWKDVFEWYNDQKKSLVFIGEGSRRRNSFRDWGKKQLLRLGGLGVKHYARLRKYIPDRIDWTLQEEYRLKKVREEVAQLEECDKPVVMGMFEYEPAPGTFMSGLSRTKDILGEESALLEVFQPAPKK